MSPSSQVRVGLRVRPLTSTEQSKDGKAVVQVSPLEKQLVSQKENLHTILFSILMFVKKTYIRM